MNYITKTDKTSFKKVAQNIFCSYLFEILQRIIQPQIIEYTLLFLTNGRQIHFLKGSDNKKPLSLIIFIHQNLFYMKTNFTLFFTLFFFITNSIFGQNLLNIHDPNQWSPEQGQQGTITSATISIQPQGTYMDVSMYLTISDQGTSFWADLLEVVLDFNLPEGAIVYDSWLWMMDDTTIVKADVLDILSATQNYEDIVDRNMDPSLLYRKDNGTYQIRIFPLEPGNDRRIKISYLAPAIWSDSEVSCGLPLHILQTSAFPLSDLQLITFPNETWTNPTILGGENHIFTEIVHPEYGEALVTNISGDLFQKNLQFAVDSPIQDEQVFVHKLVDGSDKFYQMVYNPPSITNESDPSNILFLLDHQSYNTNINPGELINEVKKNMEVFIEPQDQWNILYSSANGVNQLSDQWLEGSAESLSTNLSALPPTLDNDSHLIQILEDGINFIKEHEGNGDIVLTCNSSSLPWNYNIDFLLELIGTDDIRIHIINYQSSGFYYENVWQGPDFYTYSNQRIFTELTLHTGGTLHGSLEGSTSLWSSIPSALRNIKRSNDVFELQTSLSDGFTYQKFNPAFYGQSQGYGLPIMEVGKFTGSGDLEIEFSGIGDTSFIFDVVTVTESEMVSADSLTREIWTGHKIREMEAYVSNTGDQQEIVELSKTERVLSEYTAFLALDLEQGAEPCFNCWDFDDIIISNTDLEEEKPENINIQIFPNPFTNFVTISFELTDQNQNLSDLNQIEFEIHDRFGRLIYHKNIENFSSGNNYQVVWDGSTNLGEKVPSGIYYLTLKTEKNLQTSAISLVR